MQCAVHLDHKPRIIARRLVKTVDILRHERTEVAESFKRDKSAMGIIGCCVKRR